MESPIVATKDLDETLVVNVQGTQQKVRLRASRRGLPPLLVVQAGPGFPVLNEVSRFQKCLRLEEDFTVAYWEQRGCGTAPRSVAQSVTMKTQQDDLEGVIRWLSEKTGQQVVVFGISLGATLALKAALREKQRIKAVIAISPDTDLGLSDAAAYDFILGKCSESGGRKLLSGFRRLGRPPYADPARFQLRARLMSDLGGIEHGKSFARIMRRMLGSVLAAYGPLGAFTALRNMNTVQARLLPELVGLNLFTAWPQSGVPIRFFFGEADIMAPASLVAKVSEHLGPEDRLITLPRAGHMVHFDQPQAVRETVMQARRGS